MNSGAIEFSESKWTSNNYGNPIDLMEWLNENLEPGYQIFKLATDKTYFVGESNTLFDSIDYNKKYPIYNIKFSGIDFRLDKTMGILHL